MTDSVEPLAVQGDPPDDAEREGAAGALRRGRDTRVLSADGSKGTLDWLPELVRMRRIDFSRLSIVALPDQLADAYQLPPRTLWPVLASIARIRDRLAVLPDGSALTSFLPDLKGERLGSFQARSALASTLIAGLELARDCQLSLDQEEPWKTIQVVRRST